MESVARIGLDAAAPHHVVTGTLALLYGTGGLSAELAAAGSAGGGPRAWAMAGTGLIAQIVAVALVRWGYRWPQRALHALIAAGSGLIAGVTALSPETYTAVLTAAIGTFVGVIASFFPDLRVATAHVLLAVLTSSVALQHAGAPTATVAGLQVIVLTLVAVTRVLVLRAATAGIDPLTGLANRRSFDETLTRLSAGGGVLSAALLDLDHFKQVNDTLGHHAGDALLRRVADCWTQALPASAVLARHGGDEFALLLPGTTAGQALKTVQSLVALLPDVGVSAGVAQHDPTQSAAQLMRRADLALYQVKEAGRGQAALHHT